MTPKVEETMMAIVQYTDGVLYTCNFTDIVARKNNHPAVKYKDKKSYDARVLIFSRNRVMLDQIQSHLQGYAANVRLGILTYTGTRLSCSQILQAAKKKPEDRWRIFINETILPNIDSTDGQSYKFDVEENFIETKNLKFLEAVVEEKTNTPVFETVHSSSHERSQLSESSSADISLSKNGDDAIHTNSGEPCEEDPKSLNSTAIDLSEVTPASTAILTHCQTDSGEDDRQSLSTTVIDVSKPPTLSTVKFTNCDTRSGKESQMDLKSSEATDSLELTITSSYAKPRVISNEVVKFDLVRTPSCVNTTYDVNGLSIIGDELDGDSSMLQALADDLVDGSPMASVLYDIIPSQNHRNYSESSNSPGVHHPPVMSSTIIESSTMSTSMGIPADSNDTDDEDKDEDYEPPEESDTTDIELSNASTHNESDDDNPLVLDISITKKSAPDDTNMHVATSATPVHTKKHFCFYCKTMQSKLARHLEYKHANEEQVKKFINLPPRNWERQQIISTIRKNGNHLFNTDRRFNDGNLLVCRRPNKKMNKTAQDFMACAKCKGQYARSVIRHHWRKCTKRVGKADRIVMVKGRAVMKRFNEKANALVSKYVFPYMREDNVVRTIRYDEILVLYANKQGEQYGTHHHAYQMVRARLRLLGRLLVALKKIDSTITDFASIFNPRCYDSCIVAVKLVAQFNEKTRTFKHPAVASNIGTLLKHVGDLLRSECIKSEDERKQKRVEDFLKLLSENYGTAINRLVAETQMQNTRRKQVELPSLDDIRKLHEYLKTERENCMQMLRNNFSSAKWLKLAEVTLISLQIFNRRRAGEIERIYTEDFESYQSIDASANKEVFNSLSKDAQTLAQKYVRFMIRGKRGRGVPVLVPSDLLESMNMIKKFRRQAKVPDDNPYFFGLRSDDPNRHKYLRACNLLRQFAVACGAKVPNSLRGTKLRKHIATHCINLNLSETQVTDLANFMGHHDKIHKEIYRQPIVERDITKMSKLLECALGTEDGGDETELNESDTDEALIENDQNIDNTIPPQEAQVTCSGNKPILKMGTASKKE